MIISIKLHIKKNVDYLLRLRSPRYRQTPMHHIRVKAHAVMCDVSINFYSWCSMKFGDFG